MKINYSSILRSPLFLLVLIFCLALFLRLYKLGEIPFGLHEDELMNGYVGRFILQNGKDLYGNRWPLLYFDNFGDFPNVIPMYISGIFTFLLGVSVFAIRFPIAVTGALVVLPVYWLTKKLFANSRLGLLAAGLIAITPWHIILSRSTAENILATTAYLTGITLLLYWFEKQTLQPKLLLLSCLTLASTYILYPGYRIIIPLTFLLGVFFVKSKRKKIVLSMVAVFFLILTMGIAQTRWGKGRFQQTSIFYFNNTVQGRIDGLAIGEGPNQIRSARLFHNKVVGFTREFLHQYVSYFSFPFLFSEGGLPGRYRLDDSGLLYYSFLILCVLAFLSSTFIPNKKGDGNPSSNRFFLFILLLFALSPLPSALTLDDVPNVHRTVSMSVFFVILTTFAYSRIPSLRWKKFPLRAFFLLFIAIEGIYFWHQWIVHGSVSQTAYRGDDRTTLANYIIANQKNYDQIFLPQDAKPLYVLFYSNNFDSSLAGKFGENIRLSQVGNINFTRNNCPSEEVMAQLTARSLLVDRGECSTTGPLKQIHVIHRINATQSFRIYTLDPVLATQSGILDL